MTTTDTNDADGLWLHADGSECADPGSHKCSATWTRGRALPPGFLLPLSAAGRLRYMATKLREGESPLAVAFALDVLADEA